MTPAIAGYRDTFQPHFPFGIPAEDSMRLEVGFRSPVRLTPEVYAKCVVWTEAENLRKHTCQDEDGRWWDLLYMAALSANTHPDLSATLFCLYVVPAAGFSCSPVRTILKLEISHNVAAGDFLLISFPWEN